MQRLTQVAVDEVDALPETAAAEHQRVVGRWAESVLSLGIDVKGIWLVDFDNGSGYYCWQYPEESLQYFHGYEDGFRGRLRIL